jgi:hypothetical protein
LAPGRAATALARTIVAAATIAVGTFRRVDLLD